MRDPQSHPFQPGVEVVVRVEGNRFSEQPRRWRRDTVAKVYKSSRFILTGDPERRQYRPCMPDQWSFEKFPHGSHSMSDVVYLASDKADAVARDNAVYALWERWRKIELQLGKVRWKDLTEESLALLEQALKHLKKKDAANG